ncbi:MAG: FAD-binding oxidoreductase [Alphaproteobacteria bacterium]|nr:FAD-binding oxidoreductase [Alphaproteobacteria bacterium]
MTQRAKYLVIGRGMLGTAAGMHLATVAGDAVLLLGPGEPVGAARVPLGAFHDAGRITRIADENPVWAEFARHSIARYRQLEVESEIPFYRTCGLLWLDADSARLAHAAEVGAEACADVVLLSAEEARERFPEIAVPATAACAWQPRQAGVIDPRAYRAAMEERTIAKGGRVLDAVAAALAVDGGGVTVALAEGGQIRAERALIATGAYGALDGLAQRRLPLAVLRRTTVMAEVAAEAAAGPLADLPSLIGKLAPAPWWYLTPPLLYPDGRYYVKIGETGEEIALTDVAALDAWFAGAGDPRVVEFLRAVVARVLPSVEVLSWRSRGCAVVHTPHGLPLLDWAHPARLAVALGCMGSAAKSADAIGECAARLLQGQPFPGGLDPARFTFAAAG